MNILRRRFSTGLRRGLALLAIAGGLAALTGCHRTPEQRAEWVVCKISRKLSLTPEQKTKLEAVKQAFLDARKSHQADRAKRLEAVKQLILSDRLDEAKTKALIAEHRKAMDEGFDAVFAKLADFHASLTPEQRRKIADFLDKFAARVE